MKSHTWTWDRDVLVPRRSLAAVAAGAMIWVRIASGARGAGQAVRVGTNAELVAAAEQARPGTRIQLAPGEYPGGVRLGGVHGAPGRPIVLEAADPEQPPEIVGGASGWHLVGPQHVELRGLVFRGAAGNGLNIDDGGDRERPASHLLLREIQVRDVGPRGNCDGIKLSGVDHFLVDRCSVERWGESGSAMDMVGCHDGEIRRCEFRFRGDVPGNGVQTKGGSARIAIRHCRFENAGGRAVNLGGSTGRDYFRPADAGYEARDIRVEDCTLIGSAAPIAFVGVDGAVVRYNTIYRPRRWVLRILQESQGPEFIPCRKGVFAHNIVAFRGDEVRAVVNVGGGAAPETFRFEGNHWYCLDDPARSGRLDLPTAEVGGSVGAAPGFRDAEGGDFGLDEGSPVRDAGPRRRPR